LLGQAIIDHGRERNAITRIDRTLDAGKPLIGTPFLHPITRIDRTLDAGKPLIGMTSRDDLQKPFHIRHAVLLNLLTLRVKMLRTLAS
jgi:hypothetical protein